MNQFGRQTNIVFENDDDDDGKNREKESNQINVTYLLRARQRYIPKFLVVARGLYSMRMKEVSFAYVITPQLAYLFGWNQ